MTEREEIDMLRREVADLRDRLRALEARPATPVYVPIGPPPMWPSQPSPWAPMPPVTCESPRTGDMIPPYMIGTATGGGLRPGDPPAQSWG